MRDVREVGLGSGGSARPRLPIQGEGQPAGIVHNGPDAIEVAHPIPPVTVARPDGDPIESVGGGQDSAEIANRDELAIRVGDSGKSLAIQSGVSAETATGT